MTEVTFLITLVDNKK